MQIRPSVGNCSINKHPFNNYCVINIEWYHLTSPTESKAGIRSQNQIVAICVARNQIDASNDDDNQYEGHIISDLLFDMIHQCSKPYNDAFNLVEDHIAVPRLLRYISRYISTFYEIYRVYYLAFLNHSSKIYLKNPRR